MKNVSQIAILLAGILWGCIGIFVRPLHSKGMESMEVVFLRVIVTSLVLFLFLLVYDRGKLKVRIKDLWCFLGTGICSIVFFNFCYFKCITLTDLSVAAVLLYTAPAMVAVMSFFLFGETITKRKIIAIILTFAGCVFVTGIASGGTSEISFGGILVGLGAGFGYALYSVFSRYALEKGYSSMTISLYTFVFASIGSYFFADTRRVFEIAGRDGKIFLFCISFGIVCTVLPYLLYTAGLKSVENGKASIIASIEPVTATLLGVFVYHEGLSLGTVLGILFVFGGIIISNSHIKA